MVRPTDPDPMMRAASVMVVFRALVLVPSTMPGAGAASMPRTADAPHRLVARYACQQC